MTISQVQAMLAAGQGIVSPKTYVRDFLTTASTLVRNVRITIDTTAGWFFNTRRMTDQSAGSFRIQLYPDQGQPGYVSVGTNGSTDNTVRNECFMGTGSLPYIVSPAMIWPPVGNITFDIEDLTGTNHTIHLVFDGFLFFPNTQGSQSSTAGQS